MTIRIPPRWNRRPLHPGAERLRAIRTSLRLTQRQMAEALGVPVSTIRNWEYGMLASAPNKNTLDAAEKMLSEVTPVNDRLLHVSGHQLVADWCKRLFLLPNDYAGISIHLGVARTTPFRWINEKSRPILTVLQDLDSRVDEVRLKLDTAPRPSRQMRDWRIACGRPSGRFASAVGLKSLRLLAIERGDEDPSREVLRRAADHVSRSLSKYAKTS